MIKNPYLNAVFAGAYIVLIVSVMFYVVPKGPDPATIFMPVTMLTLFTLSAAVMGYLFLGTPIQLYLDGQKKETVSFFLHTVASFAVIAVFFLIVLVALVK